MQKVRNAAVGRGRNIRAGSNANGARRGYLLSFIGLMRHKVDNK